MRPPRPRLLPKETFEWLLAFAAALCLAAVVVLAARGHP
jgi:hypothetical protein